MTTRVLFVGAGAVGGYLAAWLGRAGHAVTLVDPWAEHVQAIHERGLAVTGPHEPFEARPRALHLHEAQRLDAEFDVAFVAVKAYDTAWAVHLALRHLAPEGYVVSAQNCWPDPVVAAVAGAGRAVGLVMSRIAVACWKPGHVERGVESGRAAGHVVFRPGEHDGRIRPRTRALAEMLAVIDGAEPTDNLWGERWAKLCLNAMGNPVQAMTGLGSLDILSTPRGREITIRLGQEAARVGLAQGLRVPRFGGAPAERWAQARRPEVRQELDTLLAPKEGAGRNWRASMAQDVLKGRRTEIDWMNGHVVATGRAAGVPTPVNAAVAALVRQVEAGGRPPAPGAIEEALGPAGA